MLLSFFSAHLVDFIIIIITLGFFISAIVFEYISKSKLIDIEKRIYQDDDAYTTTDLLVESYENSYVDEIDKSIKGLDKSDDLGSIEDPFDEGMNEEEFDYFDEVKDSEKETDDIYDKIDNFALENARLSDSKHANILSDYWDEISKVLSVDLEIKKIALLEEDEDGLFSVTKNIGFSRETLDTLKFTEFDKFYSAFFSLNKSLYITDNPFENRELANMFSDDDKESIKELIFVPLRKNDNVIGVLCASRAHESVGLNLEYFREKVILKSVL